MKDASEAPIFAECRQWLLDNLDRFENLTKEDVEGISPNVCNCITLSTLHGCPPQEIERIARYLIEEKHIPLSNAILRFLDMNMQEALWMRWVMIM